MYESVWNKHRQKRGCVGDPLRERIPTTDAMMKKNCLEIIDMPRRRISYDMKVIRIRWREKYVITQNPEVCVSIALFVGLRSVWKR